MRKILIAFLIAVLLTTASTCSANLLDLNQWKLITRIERNPGFSETYYNQKNVFYDHGRHWVEFWFSDYYHGCRGKDGLINNDSYFFTRAIVDYRNFSYTIKQAINVNERGEIVTDTGEINAPFYSLASSTPENNTCYKVALILRPPGW